jgi:hypothetical protein
MFNLFKKAHQFNSIIKSADYNFDTDVNVPVDITEIENIINWAEKQTNAVGIMNTIYNNIKNDIANNADDFVVYVVLHCVVNNKQIKVYTK